MSPRTDPVLKAIRQHIKAKGYSPTVRELCAATDFSSPSTVHARLRALESKGEITRTKGKPRTIVLAEES